MPIENEVSPLNASTSGGNKSGEAAGVPQQQPSGGAAEVVSSKNANPEGGPVEGSQNGNTLVNGGAFPPDQNGTAPQGQKAAATPEIPIKKVRRGSKSIWPWKKETDGSASFLRAARAGNLDKVLEFLKANTDINTCNANGLNALHLASKEGHAHVVSALIERGASVDSATKKGNTALHIASLAGQEEIVRILVENGASVNIQSQNGFTPLYMAAQENHDSVVRFLLSHGANQSLATEDGFTPLAVALQQGHDKVVAVLLENDTRGKVRLPALHIAAKKDDTKAATLLLHTDHNPDVTSKSGFTPLHIASHYGNDNIAALLIQRKADVNFIAKHQITPLHVASKWGKGTMVSLLIEKGANIEAKTRDGLTPLHCAARSGHETVVDMLLEKGAPITAKTKNGLAPLHMASQGDHVDAARILLYHKAPVDDVTVDFLTALHVAAHCGHVRVAKLLLDRKADPNSRALNGFTPLHIACKKNRIKVVELLLKHGASIEATTESGLTPLHVASFMGCMNIVIYLIQHGASADVPTVRGETPLHLAARANQTDIIRILLRNGAEVDARAREQQTALHIASRLGNSDIVVLLLQHGANVDAATKDSYTPLHIAAKEGQEEVASVLLEHGASLTSTTKKGFTPLHLAAKYGNMKVARLLLQKDSAVDPQGKNGVTPLHVAAHYDHQNVALLLLDKGASPHATAKNGYTPLHIAARKNQMDIATTLLEYGASSNAESKAGFTPLHLSAQEGHSDMSTLLIEHGASPGAASKNGLTPLHLCSQEDRVNVGAILVKNGAEIDPKTKAGYTPLHVAAHFGQMNMVRFLLQHGTKVDVPTQLGYTPLHQAAQQGHTQVVNLLLENKAEPNMQTNDGKTALSIAQRLGYISVVETLKIVTETRVTTSTTTTTEEKYKVVVPETMHETFMSESEDEGGDDTIDAYGKPGQPHVNLPYYEGQFKYTTDDTMLGDQSYKYLTVDEMKSLGDDSLPIDVTKDERMDTSFQSNTLVGGGAPVQAPLDHISPQHKKELLYAQHTDNIEISRPPVLAGMESLNTTLNTSFNVTEEPLIITTEPLQEGLVVPDQEGIIPLHATVTGQASAGEVLNGWEQFLVSFMVDARGGAMRGCRHSGVRVIIPPRKAAMPMRITCRYLKKDKLVHAPPLMEGEALASRILEMGPSGAKFLGPVIIEVPHFASLRAKEREIVILRSDNGETWREHTLEATEEAVQDVLNESFDGEELKQLEDLNTNRITRILTTDFPQYFAIVTRIRQEVHAIGPEGGMVSSTVVPQVQAVFPQGALTKKIKVGLQAQPISPDLVAKLLGNRVAVSPIVTVEPRRRKFHKPITLTIPVPQAASKGMINQYSGEAPTLRLLCSITGGTTRAQWEDVTGSTPLTFVNDCVSFTTTVSARFWLMDCTNIPEATKMATELYREAIHVPFMAKFVVFCKRHQLEEARARVFCMTDDKEDKTLETQENFSEVAKSRDVEVLEGKSQYLEFAGNLVPITKSGDQLAFNFYAFRENRLPFTLRVKDQNAEPVGRVAFMRQPKVGRGDPPQTPICNLNLSLPENVQPEPAPSEPDLLALEKKYTFLSISKADTIHKADLRLSDISNMLASDWIALAKELEINDSDINIIMSQYPNNAPQQAIVMLRLWMKTQGNKANGNSLEKGLRTIGRVDIVNECICNLELVTDDMERAMATQHLDRSGFESLRQELAPVADLSLNKDTSLEVSYDEKDIMKEAESADEEEELQRILQDKKRGQPDLSPTYETEEKKYAAEEKIIKEQKDQRSTVDQRTQKEERKPVKVGATSSVKDDRKPGKSPKEELVKDGKTYKEENMSRKDERTSREGKKPTKEDITALKEEKKPSIEEKPSPKEEKKPFKGEKRSPKDDKISSKEEKKYMKEEKSSKEETFSKETRMEKKLEKISTATKGGKQEEVTKQIVEETKSLEKTEVAERATMEEKLTKSYTASTSSDGSVAPEKRSSTSTAAETASKKPKEELLQKLGEELGKLEEKLEERYKSQQKGPTVESEDKEVHEDLFVAEPRTSSMAPISQVVIEDFDISPEPSLTDDKSPEPHVTDEVSAVHPVTDKIYTKPPVMDELSTVPPETAEFFPEPLVTDENFPAHPVTEELVPEPIVYDQQMLHQKELQKSEVEDYIPDVSETAKITSILPPEQSVYLMEIVSKSVAESKEESYETETDNFVTGLNAEVKTGPPTDIAVPQPVQVSTEDVLKSKTPIHGNVQHIEADATPPAEEAETVPLMETKEELLGSEPDIVDTVEATDAEVLPPLKASVEPYIQHETEVLESDTDVQGSVHEEAVPLELTFNNSPVKTRKRLLDYESDILEDVEYTEQDAVLPSVKPVTEPTVLNETELLDFEPDNSDIAEYNSDEAILPSEMTLTEQTSMSEGDLLKPSTAIHGTSTHTERETVPPGDENLDQKHILSESSLMSEIEIPSSQEGVMKTAVDDHVARASERDTESFLHSDIKAMDNVLPSEKATQSQYYTEESKTERVQPSHLEQSALLPENPEVVTKFDETRGILKIISTDGTHDIQMSGEFDEQLDLTWATKPLQEESSIPKPSEEYITRRVDSGSGEDGITQTSAEQMVKGTLDVSLKDSPSPSEVGPPVTGVSGTTAENLNKEQDSAESATSQLAELHPEDVGVVFTEPKESGGGEKLSAETTSGQTLTYTTPSNTVTLLSQGDLRPQRRHERSFSQASNIVSAALQSTSSSIVYGPEESNESIVKPYSECKQFWESVSSKSFDTSSPATTKYETESESDTGTEATIIEKVIDKRFSVREYSDSENQSYEKEIPVAHEPVPSEKRVSPERDLSSSEAISVKSVKTKKELFEKEIKEQSSVTEEILSRKQSFKDSDGFVHAEAGEPYSVHSEKTVTSTDSSVKREKEFSKSTSEKKTDKDKIKRTEKVEKEHCEKTKGERKETSTYEHVTDTQKAEVSEKEEHAKEDKQHDISEEKKMMQTKTVQESDAGIITKSGTKEILTSYAEKKKDKKEERSEISIKNREGQEKTIKFEEKCLQAANVKEFSEYETKSRITLKLDETSKPSPADTNEPTASGSFECSESAKESTDISSSVEGTTSPSQKQSTICSSAEDQEFSDFTEDTFTTGYSADDGGKKLVEIKIEKERRTFGDTAEILVREITTTREGDQEQRVVKETKTQETIMPDGSTVKTTSVTTLTTQLDRNESEEQSEDSLSSAAGREQSEGLLKKQIKADIFAEALQSHTDEVSPERKKLCVQFDPEQTDTSPIHLPEESIEDVVWEVSQQDSDIPVPETVEDIPEHHRHDSVEEKRISQHIENKNKLIFGEDEARRIATEIVDEVKTEALKRSSVAVVIINGESTTEKKFPPKSTWESAFTIETSNKIGKYIQEQLTDEKLDEKHLNLIESVAAKKAEMLQRKLGSSEFQLSLEITDEDLKSSGAELSPIEHQMERLRQMTEEDDLMKTGNEPSEADESESSVIIHDTIEEGFTSGYDQANQMFNKTLETAKIIGAKPERAIDTISEESVEYQPDGLETNGKNYPLKRKEPSTAAASKLTIKEVSHKVKKSEIVSQMYAEVPKTDVTKQEETRKKSLHDDLLKHERSLDIQMESSMTESVEECSAAESTRAYDSRFITEIAKKSIQEVYEQEAEKKHEKIQPHVEVKMRKKTHIDEFNRRSGTDFDTHSSSGESHYFTAGEGTDSRPVSRPCSSDVDILLSATPGTSEYDTAPTSQDGSQYSHTSASPQDFSTAPGSISSQDSMKSVDSESSGHLGSVELSSEASETLVPSSLDLEKDMELLDKELIEEEMLQKTTDGTIIQELTDYSGVTKSDEMHSSLENESDDSELQDEVAPHVSSKMKRSMEMTFHPEPKALVTEEEFEEPTKAGLEESTVSDKSFVTVIEKENSLLESSASDTIMSLSNQSVQPTTIIAMKDTATEYLIPQSGTNIPPRLEESLSAVTITATSVPPVHPDQTTASMCTQVTSESKGDSFFRSSGPAETDKLVDISKRLADVPSYKIYDQQLGTAGSHSVGPESMCLVSHDEPEVDQNIACELREKAYFSKYDYFIHDTNDKPEADMEFDRNLRCDEVTDRPKTPEPGSHSPLVLQSSIDIEDVTEVDKRFSAIFTVAYEEPASPLQKKVDSSSIPDITVTEHLAPLDDKHRYPDLECEEEFPECHGYHESASQSSLSSVTSHKSSTTDSERGREYCLESQTENDLQTTEYGSFEVLDIHDIGDIAEFERTLNYHEQRLKELSDMVNQNGIPSSESIMDSPVMMPPTIKAIKLETLSPASSDSQGLEELDKSIEETGFSSSIEEQRRWLEMQFEESHMKSAVAYEYPQHSYLEHIYSGPLEDIEEEKDDYERRDLTHLTKTPSLSSTPEYDVLAGRRFFTRSGDNDDLSTSSLQEFENLEEEVARRQSSSGSQESLNGKRPGSSNKSAHGDDISVSSYSSLTEFERLEKECLLVEQIESKVRAEEQMLSEIEEGHESQISESESCETVSEAEEESPRNYERKIFEIEEIIRQAQSNVENFAKEGVSLRDIVGISVSTEDRTPSVEPPDSLEETLQCSQTHSCVVSMVVSTDSLESKSNSESTCRKPDIMSASQDSIENARKDFMATSADSLGKDDSSGREGDISSGSERISHPHGGPMEWSTDSLEPTSSQATNATYQYETDSVMSGSFTSGCSNTLVASGEDISDLLNASVYFQEGDLPDDSSSCTVSKYERGKGRPEGLIREVIEESSEQVLPQVVTRIVGLPPEIQHVTFSGTDSRKKLEEFMKQLNTGEHKSDAADKAGNIRILKDDEKQNVTNKLYAEEESLHDEPIINESLNRDEHGNVTHVVHRTVISTSTVKIDEDNGAPMISHEFSVPTLTSLSHSNTSTSHLPSHLSGPPSGSHSPREPLPTSLEPNTASEFSTEESKTKDCK